jgi:peroxiredoxin
MLSTRRSAQLGLLAAILILISSIGVLVVQARQGAKVTAPTAPLFTLTDCDGRVVNLEDMRGHVVVLLFTHTDCATSRAYTARWNALADKYASSGVRVLAVNSHGESPDKIARHTRETGQNFWTLRDETGEVARTYGAKVSPYCVVIGPLGRLRYAGAFDNNLDERLASEHWCEDAVQALLAGEHPPVSLTQAFGGPM